MRGAIDGIREELIPSTQGGDDDDNSWVLAKVIVKCKHQMYKLQASPPLYEMIQITAYCFMYQVQDANLVQVLREKNDENIRNSRKKSRNTRMSSTLRTKSQIT